MANGLLDLMKSPAAMGLLAAGFGGLAGANRNTPINNLGRAGLAGLAGYSAADALQQKQVKLDQEKAIKDAIPTLYGQDGKFDYQRAAQIGVSPEQIKAYAELPNVGRPKVARTIEVPGVNGELVKVQYDDYGNQVGEGIKGYVAPQLVDTGDKKQFVTPQAGQTFQRELSPAEVLANQRAQENIRLRKEANDLTRDRLTFDKSGQDGGYSTKPIPAGALKMQDAALQAYNSAGTIDEILAAKQAQIEKGELKFGPVSNKANEAMNATGFSSPESRNYASFMSDLERMRNESLRLNMGVQTDGDAQRAWNELFQNVNDTDLVKQRLAEIRSINKRGAELQRLRVDNVRSNYNAAPYEFDAGKPQASPEPAAKPLTSAQNPPANPQAGGGYPSNWTPERVKRYEELKARQAQGVTQ